MKTQSDKWERFLLMSQVSIFTGLFQLVTFIDIPMVTVMM